MPNNLLHRYSIFIEETRAASKSPHQKFGYFLSISLQAVSVDITKNSAVGNIIQYFNHEYWNKHIYSTQKWFEECVRAETAHLETLK